jgi:hypothetical protein
MLLRDFGPYGVFVNVYCCNRCHGNAVTGLWPYGIIFMNVYCCNRCHGNAVAGLWALWNNCVYYFILSHYS